MESSGNFLEFIGLVLVLASGAFVFVTAAQIISGKRRSKIKFGTEITAFFAIVYSFDEVIVGLLGLQDHFIDIDRIIATLFWLSGAFLVNALVDQTIWRGILSRGGEPVTPRLIRDFASIFIYVIALMIVTHFVFGKPITAIAATSGALAFIIGYSAQSTLGELFAGISLQASKNIKKGDFVEIGDVYGQVHDMDWRSVTVYQFTTASLIVYPNSVLSTQLFRNHSRPKDTIRIYLVFSAEFSAPPSFVCRVTTEALKRGRHILRTPEPYVQSYRAGEYGLEYRAFWYCSGDDDYFPSQDDAYQAVWSALREHGIQPGINQRDAGIGCRFDENSWENRTVNVEQEHEALMRSEVLAALTDEERRELISGATRRVFSPPDTIGVLGSPSDGLIILASGHATADQKYTLKDPNAAADEMFLANDLVPGEAIGLRSFVNGTARSEHVQALDFTVGYHFDAGVLRKAYSENAALRADLASQIEERDAEAERRQKAHKIELARAARIARKNHIKESMATRLKSAMSGGLFGKGQINQDIAEATMAAAALIAAADGVIEAQERDAVIATFKEMELFRFVDASKGLRIFDHHCAEIEKNLEIGTKEAFDAVAKMSPNTLGAQLVVDIAIAISAADGEVEPPEEERLAEIEKILEASIT